MELTVNGQTHDVDVEDNMPLLWVLRDELGMTGTKYGCGIAQCGACTVQMNGMAVRSCQLPVNAVQGEITTVEGLSKQENDAETLHLVQQAWIEQQVPQCGYCQSGQIMSAVALLSRNPNPSDEDIDYAMGGNICRCGAYTRIRAAIHVAAKSQGA